MMFIFDLTNSVRKRHKADVHNTDNLSLSDMISIFHLVINSLGNEKANTCAGLFQMPIAA